MDQVPRLATVDDLPSWLELAAEVESLFGPMPGFDDQLHRAVERGTALVMATTADGVIGGTLLSRDGRPHHINWLAVRNAQRRHGVGSVLMTAILDRWPTGTIEVVTFTADLDEGRPARKLYERFGFVCHGLTTPAPDGGARDLFVLHRDPA